MRIDAVVTDKNDNIVSDLTADDFELFQDGKKQTITSVTYVPVGVPTVPGEPAKTPLKSNNVVGAPPLPAATPVRRENIQRTFAIVVDDLGMSVESLYYVKRGLHTFVDESVQPGDLVALVRTGGSLGGLQPFTTDPRVLHAAIDNLKWNAFSRSGVEAFAPVNEFGIIRPTVPTGPGGSGSAEVQGVGDFSELDEARNTVMAAGTLGALNLVVQGAKNLPGRKAVLFVSEGFKMLETGRFDNVPQRGRVGTALDRAIDQATRAGVVIYSIDARGLHTGGLIAADDFNCSTPCPNDMFEQKVRDRGAQRNRERRDTQEGMTYLAEQTGGFAVVNTNDIGKGLARAAADVRDYYVIGYAPDADTFAAPGKTARLHDIDVRVKRPGLKIRTRKSFVGVSDTEHAEAAETPAQQLVNAAISPFTSTDIAVQSTLLPGYAPDSGLFVRALLHIDASALRFTPGADGKSTASVDVLGMVFDRDGTEVAHLSTGFEAALTGEARQDALRQGLAYALRIPVRKAGPYQVRFAVRDRAANTFGTAGEFIDLPDVAGGAFALSGIVLRAANEQGGAAEDRVVVSAAEAVRAYAPGTELQYAYEIYNAPGPVRTALTIWRGTERVVTAPPDTLQPPAGPEKWFAARGAFKLGAALPPGRYVLQIAATSAKSRGISQSIDFEVRRLETTPQLHNSATPK